MPSCQRAWPSRLMREKGDVSVMYSYLLIESPTGQKVRRSHLWCLPRQPSHTLRSLLLPHCSVFWHFSCKHNPQEVKNRIVFCRLSSFPYKKVKWAKCRLLDKKLHFTVCSVGTTQAAGESAWSCFFGAQSPGCGRKSFMSARGRFFPS